MAEFPTVTNILCTPLIAPLARPMRTASGTLPGAALALIDIETDAGITGSAYIFWGRTRSRSGPMTATGWSIRRRIVRCSKRV